MAKGRCSTLGGAVTGGMAGLTAGYSLVITSAGAGAGAAAGGVLQRGIDGDNSTVALDGEEMVTDAAGGALGGAAGKFAGSLIPAGAEGGRQVSSIMKKAVVAGGKMVGKAVGGIHPGGGDVSKISSGGTLDEMMAEDGDKMVKDMKEERAARKESQGSR